MNDDIVLNPEHLNEIMNDLYKVWAKSNDYNIPGLVVIGMFQYCANCISTAVTRLQEKEDQKAGKESNDE